MSKQDDLEQQYIDEMVANPEPTREEWQALLDKWEGKANVESLLTYGGDKGWLA